MSIAEADESGQAHMLLCRIMQGLPEAIQAGSYQSYTRRYDLESLGGVDNLSNPNWYVVWSEHMNSCIAPLCMVTFMKRPTLQDLGPLPFCIPVSVNMQKLHKEITRFLPSSELQDLENYFNSNMENLYNFSTCACELVGADMFVRAVLKSLEH